MNLTNKINPTKDQFKHLLSTYPADTPISMVNIMRFKEHVDEKGKSGREVYQEYMEQTTQFIKEVEGRLIWKGEVHSVFIGSEESEPQVIFIVSYPTVDHFRKMLQNPAYQEVAKLRTMSIEYGGLIATTQQYPAL